MSSSHATSHPLRRTPSSTQYTLATEYRDRHSADEPLQKAEDESSTVADGTDLMSNGLRAQSLDIGYSRLLHKQAYYADLSRHKKDQSTRESSSEAPSAYASEIFHLYPHRITRRFSEDSVDSNLSSTSSILSTASKISKLPHMMKSSLVSVKDFVSKATTHHHSHPPHYHHDSQHSARVPRHTHRSGSIATLSSSSTQHIPSPLDSSSLPLERQSFSARLRRRTPSAMGLAHLFQSRKPASTDPSGPVDPVTSASYSVLDSRPAGKPRRNSTVDGSRSMGDNYSYRRYSVIAEQDAVFTKDETLIGPVTTPEIDPPMAATNPPDEPNATNKDEAIGQLLFGKNIDGVSFDHEFFLSRNPSTISNTSDETNASKNERSPKGLTHVKSDLLSTQSIAQDAPFNHQRAKSCQDHRKKPSLQQLAQGYHLGNTDIASNPHHIAEQPSPIPEKAQDGNSRLNSKSTMRSDRMLPNFLITATLTTLHSKLIAECDQLLASVLLRASPTAGTGALLVFPAEKLQAITLDLHKMSDMVVWEDEQGPMSKCSVASSFAQLDQLITEGKLLAAAEEKPKSKGEPHNKGSDHQQQVIRSVKEIVSLLKQMIYQCISQYHKVYEKALVIPCKGYKIEGKNRFGTVQEDYPEIDSNTTYANATVDHMDEEAHWYRSYFVGKKYMTFCGFTDKDDPILVSAICDDDVKSEKGDSVQRHYRLIKRTIKSPDGRKIVPDSFLLNAPLDLTLHDDGDKPIPTTTWKNVIESTFAIDFNQLHCIDAETLVANGIESELLRLDESSIHRRFKFGVLYIKEGQTKEEEWFSNEHDSPKFERFLNIIGQRVALLGYNGWAAGLDTKSGDSGEYTYTDVWGDNLLAYHVSTLIPSRIGDKQQIQRKRHIGNDIVCIVFAEGRQPFNPAAIKSQFLHVFIVVHEEEWNGRIGWRVEVAMVENVPNFGPPLPEHAFFFDQAELRSFILAKLVNAEYAALKSPKFAQPMARAREGILTNIAERGCKLADKATTTRSSPNSRHSKTPSTSSDRSIKSTRSNHQDNGPEPIPTASRSSMIKDLSEAVGLSRRNPKDAADSRSKIPQTKPKKAKPLHPVDSTTSRPSFSESDLMHSTSSHVASSRSSSAILQPPANKKEERGIKHRAHTILTSFSSFGYRRNPTNLNEGANQS